MPAERPVEAVIFDMDGVLVDSEPLWHEAEVAIFRGVGVPLRPDDCLETTGLRIDAVTRHWHARHPWSDPPLEVVARRVVDRMVALIGERAVEKPGARAAVRWLAARGVPLAVASSSPRVLIEAVLERLALARHFRVVHTAEAEPEGKPHPGVYLTTARLLGVPPGRCVAVEDSAAGIRAALAAGMTCVAVPDQPVDPEVLARAHLRLDSLVDLPAALEPWLG